MKASRFTGINRGTFSSKMILFSHSRCYPGVATFLETKGPGRATVLPGSTPDSSRYMPVSPGFTTVRPGVAPVVHGAVPVTASVADHETSLESFEGSFGRKPHLQVSIPLAVLSLKPIDQWLSSCHGHGTCHLLTSQLELVLQKL